MSARKLGSLLTHFQTLADPRLERSRLHDLLDIVALTICAVICGADSWVDVHKYGSAKHDWLKGFLRLPNGIPSRDCIRRLLMALKPEAFQKCFQDWIATALLTDHGGTKRLVAIDGKTCRRSHDAAAGVGPLHIVSAWASEEGIALGQVATEAKSNEITAIPELLGMVDIKGAIVTIDAMGTQKAIADRIVVGGGGLCAGPEGEPGDPASGGHRGHRRAARRGTPRGQ